MVLHAGDAKFDPVYGMYRRAALARAGPLRPSERNDWLLTPDLSLLGAILNIELRLANRTRDYPVTLDRDAFRRRLDPARATQLKTSPRRLYHERWALAVSADLTDAQLRRCKQALRRFWLKEMARVARSRASDLVHRTAQRREIAPTLGAASRAIGGKRVE